jgi:hypothetical protein
LLTTTPMKRVSRLKLKEEIRDCCNFHAHPSQPSVVACKKRQLRDGAFYSSFLRACMSEVYALEEHSEQHWDGESETTEVLQQEMFALEGESEVCREWDWDNEDTLRVSDGEESG